MSIQYRLGAWPVTRSRKFHAREPKSVKLVSTQILSSEFMSSYVEWRNSRMEALPENRKCDRWYQAMVDDNIWHGWVLDGIMESETMLSRSALAHIYDNVKAMTPGKSPSIGSAKRGPLVLHRARNAHIRFKPQNDFFCQLQLRGRSRWPTR